MHCPKCGLQIESDEVSFCSRCGQTLDLVRAALGMDVPRETSIASRRSGVNLGVVLMFLGSLPAALGLLTDSIKLPGGFLALVVGYLAIVLGLGPIIKALRTDENS